MSVMFMTPEKVTEISSSKSVTLTQEELHYYVLQRVNDAFNELAAKIAGELSEPYIHHFLMDDIEGDLLDVLGGD